MKSFEHPSEERLKTYSQDRLVGADALGVSRHLLVCEECRAAVPLIESEQFRTAIFDERNAAGVSVASVDAKIPGSTWPNLRYLRFGFAAVALLVVILSGFWMLTTSEQSDLAGVGVDAPDDIFAPLPIETGPQPTPDEVVRAPKSISKPRPPASSADKAVQKTKEKFLPKEQKFSLSRGGNDCEKDAEIGLGVAERRDGVSFRWKVVPDAVRYHLYISDDDEVLIDEFETEKETTYLMTKPLDPAKNYKWKLVVTLKNGETVNGPSKRFSAGDLTVRGNRSGDAKKGITRCGEEK